MNEWRFDQNAEKKGKMRKMRIRVGDSGALHKDDVSELPPADECSAARRKNDLNYFSAHVRQDYAFSLQ
jgi:hypothetical protein